MVHRGSNRLHCLGGECGLQDWTQLKAGGLRTYIRTVAKAVHRRDVIGQPEYSLEKVSAKRPGEQTLVGLTGCLTPQGCGPPEPSLGGWRRCWLVMLVHPALWPIPSRH